MSGSVFLRCRRMQSSEPRFDRNRCAHYSDHEWGCKRETAAAPQAAPATATPSPTDALVRFTRSFIHRQSEVVRESEALP